ncbi:uncharacterized protein TNCV_3629951 [Trichonephila clavipes]|nr:uncharacterized protein TNCV_3629951 [Trichonephila clavipes]
MYELNLDQSPQDINKEQFQLESVRLQAFVAATGPGYKELRENTLEGGQRPPNSLPLPPTSREDLRLDGYLEYSHAAKALFINKHPCLLRDSNPGPMTQCH